ncbi:MAG: rubredoxin [Bdellovibrionales bacterium]|nr:rubredoxin [Bdellovibrionales bacterium]
MNRSNFIKINFTGGILSPGDLLKILKLSKKLGIDQVSFGLRQQLILITGQNKYTELISLLSGLNLSFEMNTDLSPNIVSSYPATEAFIVKSWFSEGIYKDIFDLLDYVPRLKINISDNNQSFTPLFTGNINWVASSSLHFWHLFVRFPKTNKIYEWKELIYTNDLIAVSQRIENIIFLNEDSFYDNEMADGDLLYKEVKRECHYNSKHLEQPLKTMAFRLPYYEGFNRYSMNYFWLGIYRRDELFSIDFLQDICELCLTTKVGQICSTPWKSLMIKGIEEKDRIFWDAVLAKHLINVRHAANELNFQVEDQNQDALNLKHYIIKRFNKDDLRTFAICFGIKINRKSEIYCNILIRRKPLLRFGRWNILCLYDIFYSNKFDPNERRGFEFSRNLLRPQLPRKLKIACKTFNAYQHKKSEEVRFSVKEDFSFRETAPEFLDQCSVCLTIYDETLGDTSQEIPVYTSFQSLPNSYRCPLCEAPKSKFRLVEQSSLGVSLI